MTRLRTRVLRALVLALLLLSISGSIANAAPPGFGTMLALPDDPGYGITP